MTSSAMLVAWSATRSKIARDQQRIQRLPDEFRTLVHALHELDEGIIAHAIDHVVHFENSLRQFDFALR